LDTPEGELTLADDGQLSARYLTKAMTNRTEQGGSTTAEHRGIDTVTSENALTDNTEISGNTTVSGNSSQESENSSNTTTSDTTTTTGSAENSTNSSQTAENTATTSSTATSENSSSSSQTAKINNTNDYIKNIVVKNPNLAMNSIEKLRKNILNIDMMIIDELSELFMQVY
jgi:hypothetical protein